MRTHSHSRGGPRRKAPLWIAALLPLWALTLTGCPSAQDILNQQTASGTPVISQVSPVSGRVGSAVAIQGLNFGDQPGTVAFKSPVDGSKIFSKVDSWASTLILIEVPAFPVTTCTTQVGLQTATGGVPATFGTFSLTN